MQVRGKNIGIFIDGAVLDDATFAAANLKDIVEAVVEEIDLQVERPTLHVFIEIVYVGIFFNIFEVWLPIEMVGEEFGKGGFSGTDVSGKCYVLHVVKINTAAGEKEIIFLVRLRVACLFLK
jgi:hypothetical protein